MRNEQTVFLISPKRSLVKPRSSGSCVCDDVLPIFSFVSYLWPITLNDKRPLVFLHELCASLALFFHRVIGVWFGGFD